MSFDPNHDAKALREAMKGLGTNDKVLVSIIANRTNEQLQEVRAAFNKEFGRDLIDDITSECTGDYERLAVGCLLTRPEFDAKMLKEALAGAGTDDQQLVDIISHRSDKEVEAIKEAYLAKYGKTLEHDIQGDLSGNTEKLFIGLLNDKAKEAPIDEAALRGSAIKLYNAGQGKLGTDEATFIQILTTSGAAYLKALNYKYAQLYGDSFLTAVEKETGGYLSKTFKALLTPHDEYYADVIAKAVDGAGTNDKRLITTIVGRRHVLRGINIVFVHKYGKSLKHRIEQECSGQYKNLLVDILDEL